MIPKYADVVIIGSGFGGSIAAFRFAQSNKKVVVLEMGERWSKDHFEHTQDPKYIFRLYRDYPSSYLIEPSPVVITQGMGIGGTSLVYCGILERIPEDVWKNHPVFDKWPYDYHPENLTGCYGRVEFNLNVHEPDYTPPRAWVMDEVCMNLGLSDLVLRNLAVGSVDCKECGWCTMGCTFGAKMDMARSYILEAERAGAIFAERCKALFVRKAFKGYKVYYRRTTSVDRDYHLITGWPYNSIWAKKVVIAAGCPESPALLMRSRPFLNSFPDNDLGRGISGNGDIPIGAIIPGKMVDTAVGRPMSRICREARGDFIIVDMHAPPIGPAVKYKGTFESLTEPPQFWGKEYKQTLKNYGKHLLILAVISMDEGNISIKLDSKGNVVIRKSSNYTISEVYDQLKLAFKKMGTDVDVGVTDYDLTGRLYTAHPIGGCKMGSVVDPKTLEVYNNPGLHVIDASVLPSATVVGPALTVAAVAEKAMDTILR
jgi:choline dehydrogenase-like flavoprotein